MYEGYRRFQLAHPPFRLSVTSQPVFLISSTSGWPRLAVWSSLHRSGQNRMITAKGMGTHGELSCPPSHIFSVHSLDMGALPLDRMSWVIIGLPRHDVFAYFALPHLNAQVLIRLIYHSWSREKNDAAPKDQQRGGRCTRTGWTFLRHHEHWWCQGPQFTTAMSTFF